MVANRDNAILDLSYNLPSKENSKENLMIIYQSENLNTPRIIATKFELTMDVIRRIVMIQTLQGVNSLNKETERMLLGFRNIIRVGLAYKESNPNKMRSRF